MRLVWLRLEVLLAGSSLKGHKLFKQIKHWCTDTATRISRQSIDVGGCVKWLLVNLPQKHEISVTHTRERGKKMKQNFLVNKLLTQHVVLFWTFELEKRGHWRKWCFLSSLHLCFTLSSCLARCCQVWWGQGSKAPALLTDRIWAYIRSIYLSGEWLYCLVWLQGGNLIDWMHVNKWLRYL